jgi:hypothetical protein
MAKLTFIAGLAVGYVLGARAGRERYEQIMRTSGKVWNSGPVQKQVSTAKDVARTKAAPVVADMVADAARATGKKLRSTRTVAGEAVARTPADTRQSSAANEPRSTPGSVGAAGGSGTAGSNGRVTTDSWAAATSRDDGAA